MKNRQIWRRVLCFSLPRIPFLLLAVLAVIALICLIVVLTLIFPAAEEVILAVGIPVCILTYIFINGYGGTLWRTAQIAMIARGVQDGKLPYKVFHAGTDAVHARFESVTLGQLFLGTLQTAVLRIVRRRTREEIRKARGRSLWADFRSTAVIWFSGVIPYLGYCSLAYQFVHPEVPMLQAVCDSIEVFFRSTGAMLRKIIAVVMMELLLWITTPVLLYFVFTSLLPALPVFTSLATPTAEALFGSDADAVTAVAAMLTVVTMLVLRLFAQPRAATAVIRRYLVCAEKKPSEGKIFGILPEAARQRILKGKKKAAGRRKK